MLRLVIVCALLLALACPFALALDRPMISDTFFYWYSWDYQKELGGWIGGVYNTPLVGYYDSLKYEDNLRELHTAAEWGITDHFMDYWAPNWVDHDGKPREAQLMRGTEELRKRGYNTWMSYYQDGEDFDMKDFAKNMDPGRDVQLMVQNYARNPVWPRVNDKPVWLVYGRNGSPKTTTDNPGFRQYLQEKYKTIQALNAKWGSDFKSFAEVTMDLSSGWQRAESIKYQYAIWKRGWDQVDAIAKAKYGLPGLLPSFDVAYQPYMGFSYAEMNKTFAGPSSYGGIFGPPHDQDVERFIQAQVAKAYGNVFWDSFKNYYHDWEIRVPGTCYPSAFNAFDRFWVQALMHYSEALLHLSWNEWWEGSNLEPCMEYGKTYCQKNLMYSSIMQLCFDSIHNWNSGAKVAVLLNDWHWLSGGHQPQDIYDCVQALRRDNVRFDLVADDFVTAEKLAQFDLILAPAGGQGFGENAKGEGIGDVLKAWVQGKDGRKLVLSGDKAQWNWLGLREGPPGTAPRGPDMNVYVDVGTTEDQQFLTEGFSGAEDWGKLSRDKFGAATTKYTVRWTPAVGKRTVLMLPCSPERDHVLRFAGSGFRENGITVMVEGQKAGHVDVKAGPNDLAVAVPAALIATRQQVEVDLVFDKQWVPTELDPKTWPSENRVCDLALDWVQFSTDNVGRSTKQNYTRPEATVRFAESFGGVVAGQEMKVGLSGHAMLSIPAGAQVLSSYKSDSAARDVLVKVGGSEVLYVNGLLGGSPAEYFKNIIVNWAKATPVNPVRGAGVIGTTLMADNTDVVLAYNYDIKQSTHVSAFVATHGRQLCEAQALSRDGQTFQPVNATVQDGQVILDEPLQQYGVYEVAFAPVKVETPPLVLHPGETRKFNIALTADGGKAVSGSLGIKAVVPSIIAEPAKFEVHGQGMVTLRVTAREDIEWGEKTLVLDLETEGHHAYLFRNVTVEPNADVQIVNQVVDSHDPKVFVRNQPNQFIANGDASLVTVKLGANEAKVDDLTSNEAAELDVKAEAVSAPAPTLTPVEATLSYHTTGAEIARKVPLGLAKYPDQFPKVPDAFQPVLLFNPHDTYLENFIVDIDLETVFKAGFDIPKDVYVREAGGNVVPSQRAEQHLLTLAMLPPKGACLLYLCRGKAVAPGTDLVGEQQGEGPVKVRNSRMSATLDPEAGGTLTSLVSSQTGLDYGAKSGGVTYGAWGRFNPDKPAIGTVDYVSQEDKTKQCDSKGSVRIIASGPILTTVEVAWSDDKLTARQTYSFFAYQPYFLVSSQVAPGHLLSADELVAFDFRLKRNRLTKIFPNFTGVGEAFAKDNPCAGFREGSYIPPYSTMMTPDAFAESISVVPTATNSIQRYRQGFWPEKRPDSGPVDYAELEYISLSRAEAGFAGYVLLHSGYQTTAKAFRDARLDSPPMVILPKVKGWKEAPVGGGATPSAKSGAWWNPFWHYRAMVAVGPAAQDVSDAAVAIKPESLKVPVGAQLDVNSLRALQVGADGKETGQVPVFWDASAQGAVLCTAGTLKAGATRQFALYYDTVGNGPKAPSAFSRPNASDRLLDGSFEQGEQFWNLPPGGLATEQPHTGKYCVKLDLPIRSASGHGRRRPGQWYAATCTSMRRMTSRRWGSF